MGASVADVAFVVWGIDQTPYGPVELPTLVAWVRDQRITADTWVFALQNSSWQRAGQMAELQMFFSGKSRGAPGEASAVGEAGFNPRMLRRVKILGGLTEDQLERFAAFTEVRRIPQWSVIVKQGDHGDTMYLILEGELRVRIEVGVSFVVEIDMVSDINQALYLLHRNDFDIILIDSFFDGTEPTTGILRKTDSPHRPPDRGHIPNRNGKTSDSSKWMVLYPKKPGQPEFYARLKAISRRRLSRQHN